MKTAPKRMNQTALEVDEVRKCKRVNRMWLFGSGLS